MQSPANLVPIRSLLPETVLVYIYDDGDQSIDLGDGRRLITGLRDTMLDSIHDNIDGKHPGARGRWGIVVAAKDDTPEQLAPGTKVFLEENRWARGFMFDDTGRRVNTMPLEYILLIDTDGLDEIESEKVNAWLARGSYQLTSAA